MKLKLKFKIETMENFQTEFSNLTKSIFVFRLISESSFKQ